MSYSDAIKRYHIHSQYSDTSTLYHTCPTISTSTIYYPMLCLKIAGWVANSVDPDLGLHCLLRHVYPNTYGKYDNYPVLGIHFLTHREYNKVNIALVKVSTKISFFSWKHMLWMLIRNALLRHFYCVPTTHVFKTKKEKPKYSSYLD